MPTAEAKKTRAKRVPQRVLYLSKEQVQGVVGYAFPKRPMDDPDFIECLQANINGVLRFLEPVLNSERMSEIADIRRAFTQYGEKLTEANIRLLEEIGGAHYRDVDRLSLPSAPLAAVSIALHMLRVSYQQVQGWLNDTKATGIVAARQAPLVDLQTLAGHLLPDIFRMTFLTRFGAGLNGPGPRFVAAVLREAGLRPDVGKTTMEFVRKARQRMLKPGPKAGGKLKG